MCSVRTLTGSRSLIYVFMWAIIKSLLGRTKMYVCMYSHKYSKSMDQPGKGANPARGQLNRKNDISLSAFVPENLALRHGFGSSVPRQLAHLHTQAGSGAYLRNSSRIPRRRPFIYFKPPYGQSRVNRVTRNCVPMAFTAESPPARGQQTSR